LLGASGARALAGGDDDGGEFHAIPLGWMPGLSRLYRAAQSA
jgi:hypothetical protein